MILLLGGTSETAPMAEALAHAGYRVLVSTATGIPLPIGNHPRIAHRMGRLSEQALAALIRHEGIRAIVDATHPYAAEAKATAARVAGMLEIPCLAFVRPKVALPERARIVPTHEEAAKVSCNGGLPVLLTIGSKNLEPYAREAALSNATLVVRVLSDPDSLEGCRRAGIPESSIITGRGPFTIEQNVQVLRRFGIRVMVTKESGVAGGLLEKLEAARIESCEIVIVDRPAQMPGCAFQDSNSLIRKLAKRVAVKREG